MLNIISTLSAKTDHGSQKKSKTKVEICKQATFLEKFNNNMLISPGVDTGCF